MNRLLRVIEDAIMAIGTHPADELTGSLHHYRAIEHPRETASTPRRGPEDEVLYLAR